MENAPLTAAAPRELRGAFPKNPPRAVDREIAYDAITGQRVQD